MSLIHYTTANHVAESLSHNPPVNALTMALLDDYDMGRSLSRVWNPGGFIRGIDLKAIILRAASDTRPL